MDEMFGEERVRYHNQLYNAKNELHKLMRRVIISAKIGRQKRISDDDLELDQSEKEVCKSDI